MPALLCRRYVLMVPWGWGEEREVKKIEAEKHQENLGYINFAKIFGVRVVFNGEIFCVGAR